MTKFEYPEKSKIGSENLHYALNSISRVKTEVSKVFFGQNEVVDSLIRAIICNGHVLVEGVPGIAKTLAIRTIAKVSGCSFSRIQFTVDLLPTDIVGVTIYKPDKGFEVVKGPIFANFVIADEINRSPPKTQSALIEAMQESQVTIGKETFQIPKPFFVMASQNPLESEGVYTLPEAQVDRFLFKIIFNYPEREVEKNIMEKNMTFSKFDDLDLKSVLNPEDVLKLQKIVHNVYLSDKIKDYILDIVQKSRDKKFKYSEFVEVGFSPRATIGLFIAAKSEALINGRDYVLPIDVRKIAAEVLRHRLILSYEAQSQGVNSDKVISELLKTIKAP